MQTGATRLHLLHSRVSYKLQLFGQQCLTRIYWQHSLSVSLTHSDAVNCFIDLVSIACSANCCDVYCSVFTDSGWKDFSKIHKKINVFNQDECSTILAVQFVPVVSISPHRVLPLPPLGANPSAG